MGNDRVFLSYAKENRAVVDRYLDVFRRRGIDVWIDHEQINSGESIIEHVEKAIQECRYAVIFFSKEYEQKVWPSKERQTLLYMMFESEKAGGEPRGIFVVRLDNNPLPPFLLDRIWHSNDDPAGFADLVAQKLGLGRQAPIAQKQLDTLVFLNKLDGIALEQLAAKLVRELRARQTNEPPRIVVLLPGFGKLECECMPPTDAEFLLEELEGRLRECGIHRRFIRNYQDNLNKAGLGKFDEAFRIAMDDRIADLDVVRFGKQGIRELLTGLILSIWLLA
jgi:hypothetical protein